MKIEIVSLECIGCGVCVDVCPNEALAMQDGRTTLAEAEKCEGCGVCVGFCEQEALRLPL
ncbi:MAG: 4Fe-4S binding protein [Candidatus Korobacteraceae bacterium]